MLQTSLRNLTGVRQQLHWLIWVALWLLAEYGLRIWLTAVSAESREQREIVRGSATRA